MESDGGNGSFSSSPGTSSDSNFDRSRTESEGSEKQRFILPGAAGSPPQVVTIDEVANAIKNVEDMALAHEIAINPDFKLTPYEPPENTLEKRIKDMMHKVFWDLLREQLGQTPPKYDHAIQLLIDIKECFVYILSSNNERALTRINEILDETLIRQQAEQGVLDFRAYANFVIQIMSRSCAPVRDEKVQALSEIEDVVDTFRGILETMSLMKLDMANCVLDSLKGGIIANSVEYEKKKFKDFIKLYTYGFPATNAWLTRNYVEAKTVNPQIGIDDVILNAYLEFLFWDESNEFPEILDLDKERILMLSTRALRLCVCASSLAVASILPIISQVTANREELASQLSILCQNINKEADLPDTLENIWIQVKSVIGAKLNETNKELDSTTENALKGQLLQIGNRESPIRALMVKRLLVYVKLVQCNKNLPATPPGYTDFNDEMQNFAIAFKRLTGYNYTVFGEYFHEVLNTQVGTTSRAPETETPAVTGTESA